MKTIRYLSLMAVAGLITSSPVLSQGNWSDVPPHLIPDETGILLNGGYAAHEYGAFGAGVWYGFSDYLACGVGTVIVDGDIGLQGSVNLRPRREKRSLPGFLESASYRVDLLKTGGDKGWLGTRASASWTHPRQIGPYSFMIWGGPDIAHRKFTTTFSTSVENSDPNSPGYGQWTTYDYSDDESSTTLGGHVGISTRVRDNTYISATAAMDSGGDATVAIAVNIKLGLPGSTPPETPPIYVDNDEHCDRHICRGHKMLIIIGDSHDPTIAATRAWALTRTDVEHRVFFEKRTSSSPLMNPDIPTPRQDGSVTWSRYQEDIETRPGRPPKLRNKESNDYAAAMRDCCFLEEVIILTHGSLDANLMAKQTMRTLPIITGGRSLKKLTLWICNSMDFIRPGVGSTGGNFSELCALMAPRNCPCHCDSTACRICPRAGTPAKIYLAAYHTEGDRNVVSTLSIDPSDAGNPLKSPNGTVREVTVTTGADGGWSAGTRIASGPDVFDGMRVGTQPVDPRSNSFRFSNLEERLRDVTGGAATAPAYAGPTRCPGGEGCMPKPM